LVLLPLGWVVLIVTCTARPAFSAASDAATTAVADPGDGAAAAGVTAAGEGAVGDAAGEVAAGAAGTGTVCVAVQPASSASTVSSASGASPARVAGARALRDRFTFLC
jgi:hypothetical protein